MSRNSPQQNLDALKDWKNDLDRRRKTRDKYKSQAKTIKPGYHPAKGYNEGEE